MKLTNISLYCRCGDRCLNKRFQQRKFAQLFVREVEGKGFGLFTDQGALANNCTSVCVYILRISLIHLKVYFDPVVCMLSVIIFLYTCMYLCMYLFT